MRVALGMLFCQRTGPRGPWFRATALRRLDGRVRDFPYLPRVSEGETGSVIPLADGGPFSAPEDNLLV